MKVAVANLSLTVGQLEEMFKFNKSSIREAIRVGPSPGSWREVPEGPS